MNDSDALLGPEIAWLSAVFLGTVFVLAGFGKFVSWARFRDTLAAMEVWPPRWARGIGWALPPVEIALGIAVAASWGLPVSSLLLLGLLAGFVLALAWYRLKGGKELVCGCFADFDRKSKTSGLIARNLVLLAVGLPSVCSSIHWAASRGLAYWFVGLTAVLGMLLTWSLSRQLVETLAQLRLERTTEDI